MFGFIPTDEINELANKCERFILTHLEDRSERRDFSFDSDEGSQTNEKKDAAMDGYTKVNADGDATHKELETTMNKQNVHNDILPSEKESNFSINFNANDKNKLDASNLRQPEVEGLVPNQEVEVSPQKPEQIQEMRAYDRSEKLLSSRANQRSAVWLSFFFIAGLYTLYFVLSFVGQTSFLWKC